MGLDSFPSVIVIGGLLFLLVRWIHIPTMQRLAELETKLADLAKTVATQQQHIASLQMAATTQQARSEAPEAVPEPVPESAPASAPRVDAPMPPLPQPRHKPLAAQAPPMVAAAPAPAVPTAGDREPHARATPELERPAPASARVARPALPPPPSPDPSPAWLEAAKNWLFTGNLVAKFGLLILFIGISFLLKYASERVTAPIELRLAGIALSAIALLIWGWSIRLRRRDLSLPVQGAALGILMLVVFGAFRLYQLIPSGAAFSLLFVLTAFTSMLAVLQNAVWLAVFGIAGGFLSPIMTSTGHGSHIALFSYYALLNLGVLAIALKRSWRALNLLGFAFTFVIGTAWGVLRYSHESDYQSAQLFLLLYFGFYVAIALVFALREAPQLRSYVDATLVFGTPLLAFGLQLGLMKGKEFGNAYSALGFGLFYATLALALWQRRGRQLKLLVESFLALSVVFGTLAIPFALDGRWTSAAWALEGAAVVWVGLRQKQRLTWMFGLLVQLGAWLSFIGAVTGLDQEAALHSNLWLGFALLAVAAFIMATSFRADDANGDSAFPQAAGWFLGFAAVWLMGGAWTEIVLRTSGASQANLLAASGLMTMAILTLIAVRMHWALANCLALAAQLIAGAILLVLAVSNWDWSTPAPSLFDRPVLGALMIAAGAFFSSWTIHRLDSGAGTASIGRLLLAWSAFWWFGPIMHALSGTLMLATQATPDAASNARWLPIYALGVTASALGFTLLARQLAWPALRWLGASAWPALLLMTFTMLWQLYGHASLPIGLAWLALLALLAVSEFMFKAWPTSGWPITDTALKWLHVLRTAGPWIMLWKVGEIWIARWLYSADATSALANWHSSVSWANYLPAWAMMAVIAWLIRRSRREQWPVAPIAGWYRLFLVPAATLWSLILVATWNLVENGQMAPMPYLPVLNPLDLTTAFAFALGFGCYRMVKAEHAKLDTSTNELLARLPALAALAAFGWFNLILLRTAAHFLAIAYQAPALFASQFVQAMLSLAWSITALLLMALAARASRQRQWIAGAALLGIVAVKLFLVDLAGAGSIPRIVSFVGVGVMMVLIGYLAPYPAPAQQDVAGAPV